MSCHARSNHGWGRDQKKMHWSDLQNKQRLKSEFLQCFSIYPHFNSIQHIYNYSITLLTYARHDSMSAKTWKLRRKTAFAAQSAFSKKKIWRCFTFHTQSPRSPKYFHFLSPPTQARHCYSTVFIHCLLILIAGSTLIREITTTGELAINIGVRIGPRLSVNSPVNFGLFLSSKRFHISRFHCSIPRAFWIYSL